MVFTIIAFPCLSHKVPLIALGWHHKYRNLMNDFGLGIHHLSVGDLPQDPTKSFNGFIDRKLEIRDEISNHVKEAQKLITKIEELRNISFSS
jgi:polysaccharide pyruvyl transferase WcaK-like protein